MTVRLSALAPFGLLLCVGLAACAGDDSPTGRDPLFDDDALTDTALCEASGDLTNGWALRNEDLARRGAVPALAPGRESESAPSAVVGAQDNASADPIGGAVGPLAGCGTNGWADHCSAPSCLCGHGEGDCDNDDECELDHQCAVDVGDDYGFGPLADVCIAVDECSHTIPGRGAFCSTSCPCEAGEGDCDSDAECAQGHQCAADVGADYGFGPLADVCVAVDGCSETIPGRATFCSLGCKCQPEEGDCDTDDECAAGLLCMQDVGASYGFGPLVDVCLAPCDDSTRNGYETDVDCGGPWCDPCANGRVCWGPGDCQSGICASYTCVPPHCTDGILNGDETFVDCGGPDCGHCPACDVGDCTTCLESVCAAENCATEIDACAASQDCLDFEFCRLLAGSPQDRLACEAQHQVGAPLWYDREICLNCSIPGCSVDCAASCPMEPLFDGPGACDHGDCASCANSSCAGGACSSELSACSSNQECVDFYNCYVGCAENEACIDQCEALYPIGTPLFYHYADCVHCSPDTCRGDCSLRCPIAEGLGDCDVGDCNSYFGNCVQSGCAYDACSSEISACGSNQECLDFYDCYVGCDQNESCIVSCQNQYPAGSPLFYEYANCVHCSAAACLGDCFDFCPVVPL